MLKSIALAIAALTVSALPVLAAADVVVMADQAKMLDVSGEAGTVVVGNPNIADVTVRGSRIFIHGRHYGTTNVIVLDRDGRHLAGFEVSVMQGGGHNVNVFRAAGKFSYLCAPTCESALRVGDHADYFKVISEEEEKKGKLATGADKGGE